MRTGEKGIALIKEREGLHDGDEKKAGLQPEMDPKGIWTEGYGRAMRDKKGNFIRGTANKKTAEFFQTIRTIEDAEKALKEDLSPREHLVMQKIRVPLNQNQFDAIMSFVYNTGGSSTLFSLINNKQSKSAIYTFWTTHYISQDGEVLPGLVKRRKKEADLFFS